MQSAEKGMGGHKNKTLTKPFFNILQTIIDFLKI